MNTIRKDILRNIAWGNANIFIRYVSSFIVTAIVARMYGPSEFGSYQLALTYLAIFEAINLIHPAFARNYLIADKNKENLVSSLWIFQSVMIALVAMAICLLMLAFSDKWEFWLLVSVMALRMAFRALEYVSLIADVRLRNDLVQKTQIVMIGSFNATRVVVAIAHLNIAWLYFCSTLTGLFTALYQLRLKKSLNLIFEWQFSSSEFKKIITGSFWLSLTGFLAIFQGRIASVILESKMIPDVYGNYQLVFKLVEPATAIGLIIISANYTVLAHTYQNSKDAFLKRFFKISSISVFIAILASLILVLIPQNLLTLLLGPNYQLAYENLKFGGALLLGNALVAVSANFDMLRKNYLAASLQFLSVCLVNIALLWASEKGISIEQALLIGGFSAFLPGLLRGLYAVITGR